MSFRSTVRSNSNRYIQAGNAAASAGVNISGGIAKNRPRYDKIENARQNAYADQAAAAMKAEAQVTNAAVNAKARVQMTKDDVKADKAIRGAKKQTQMAGRLAAGVAGIGGGLMLKNRKEEANPLLKSYQDRVGYYDKQMSDYDSQIEEQKGVVNSFAGKLTKVPDYNDSNSGSNSPDSGGYQGSI